MKADTTSNGRSARNVIYLVMEPSFPCYEPVIAYTDNAAANEHADRIGGAVQEIILVN